MCQTFTIPLTGKLVPLPIPPRPWYSVGVDFITDLPLSNGFDSIAVFICRLSKMAHFVPCNKTIDAPGFAKLYFDNIVKLHGFPDNITSDRGPQFISNFWKSLMEVAQTQLCFSMSFHPQSNGQTERTNQTLEQYLRIYCSYHQDDWADRLSAAEFSYNNSKQSSTLQSPFFTCYAYHPRADFIVEPSLNPAMENFKSAIIDSWSAARTHMDSAQQYFKKYADKHRSEAPTYKRASWCGFSV